jgi:hypothetical protein
MHTSYHVHSRWTDGKSEIPALLEAARGRPRRDRDLGPLHPVARGSDGLVEHAAGPPGRVRGGGPRRRREGRCGAGRATHFRAGSEQAGRHRRPHRPHQEIRRPTRDRSLTRDRRSARCRGRGRHGRRGQHRRLAHRQPRGLPRARPPPCLPRARHPHADQRRRPGPAVPSVETAAGKARSPPSRTQDTHTRYPDSPRRRTLCLPCRGFNRRRTPRPGARSPRRMRDPPTAAARRST